MRLSSDRFKMTSFDLTVAGFMFSYRHIFHAGNHADVFKHVVLTGLIDSLQRKPTAYCVLDTHAGIGLYDLKSDQALKNLEFEQGIAKIYTQSASAPELVRHYLTCVQRLNPAGKLHFYPGSPFLARQLAREGDQLIACEFNKTDNETLKHLFRSDSQAAVHFTDGFKAMNAFLPLKQKRGLVFIDPPYELKDEVDSLINALQIGLKKWPNGIYAVWYPILDKPVDKRLREKMLKLEISKLLDLQLTVKNKSDVHRMVGSGMLIINPPWQFDSEMQNVLPWLQQRLSRYGEGNFRIDILKAE